MVLRPFYIRVLDNAPSDSYWYFVTIYTGSRPNPGTTTRVTFTLFRTTSKSQVHMLHVQKRDNVLFCNHFTSVSDVPSNRYFVTIYNGSSPNSDTTARVALTLVGTTSKIQVHMSQIKKRNSVLFCSHFTSVYRITCRRTAIGTL